VILNMLFKIKSELDGCVLLSLIEGNNMKKVQLLTFVITIILSVPSFVTALPITQAYTAIADRLVANQDVSGAWAGEEDYTGSIVAGLVRAYELTGTVEYKTAAALGGMFIINSAGGNFYGDEAYALTILADITGEPNYANAVRTFYNNLDTALYIDGFKATERSNAVFYVACHAVAAHKAGAGDAGIWREGLIKYLSRIDDDVAVYPVMSLGVATWALAQTGPMDNTKIDPSNTGEDYWVNVTLKDLPVLLVGHQDLSAYIGSFYCMFDHRPVLGISSDRPENANIAGASGFTEDTVFGVLGLLAANNADPNLNYSAKILAGQTILTIRVPDDGSVREHVWLAGAIYYTYGGELLQTAMPKPVELPLFQRQPQPQRLHRQAFLPPLSEKLGGK
jgi:hypothetical protein